MTTNDRWQEIIDECHVYARRSGMDNPTSVANYTTGMLAQRVVTLEREMARMRERYQREIDSRLMDQDGNSVEMIEATH